MEGIHVSNTCNQYLPVISKETRWGRPLIIFFFFFHISYDTLHVTCDMPKGKRDMSSKVFKGHQYFLSKCLVKSLIEMSHKNVLLKSHYWFKSYGNFAEWMNFAYWWSFIGKGLRLQPAQQACYIPYSLYKKKTVKRPSN